MFTEFELNEMDSLVALPRVIVEAGLEQAIAVWEEQDTFNLLGF